MKASQRKVKNTLDTVTDNIAILKCCLLRVQLGLLWLLYIMHLVHNSKNFWLYKIKIWYAISIIMVLQKVYHDWSLWFSIFHSDRQDKHISKHIQCLTEEPERENVVWGLVESAWFRFVVFGFFFVICLLILVCGCLFSSRSISHLKQILCGAFCCLFLTPVWDSDLGSYLRKNEEDIPDLRHMVGNGGRSCCPLKST